MLRISGKRLPLIMAIILLVGCGIENDSPESNKMLAPSPTPLASPASGQTTVGDLLRRINASWPAVSSMRTTTTTNPASNDNPQTIEEVIPPASRRVTTTTNGVVVDEQIFVDGRVFMRGSFVANVVAPFAGPNTWITVDPTMIPPESPVGAQTLYLTSSVGPPFAAVSDAMRARVATPAGTVNIDGRTCAAYSFSDTTDIGDQITYELSLDENDLPCRLIQATGGFTNTSVYVFNDPSIRIVSPEGATPVSGTPEG